MDLSDLRQDYIKHSLRRKDLLDNPYEQFLKWFKEADHLLEPNAMQLATCIDNRPSLRTVLLKGVDEKGFLFFTYYGSRKGRELAANPQAALLFIWKELERQIIIEGSVEKTSPKESDDYFAKRPRKSQLAALTSVQDAPLGSLEELERALEQNEAKYKDQPVPRPENWGGYRLKPLRIEFWQGRPSRLHDRFEYLYAEGKWLIRRLSP